jgi:hypothetical protein
MSRKSPPDLSLMDMSTPCLVNAVFVAESLASRGLLLGFLLSPARFGSPEILFQQPA